MWTAFLERTGGIAVDLPGFGNSMKAGTFPYSLAAFDGFLERFLDWIGVWRFNLVVPRLGRGRARLRASARRRGWSA